MRSYPNKNKSWETLKRRVMRIGHNILTLLGFIIGEPRIGFTPESQAIAKRRRNRIIIFLIVILLMALLVIISIPWIRYYNLLIQSEIALSDGFLFIASFWGAILGAIVTGFATVITTWLIINRSNRLDYHRERIEHLPVLSIREIRGVSFVEDSILLPNGITLSQSQSYQEVNVYCDNDLNKFFELSNIGSGMAIAIETRDLTDEHNEAYFPGITTKDIVYLVYGVPLEAKNGKITFAFKDIFDNQYQQNFHYEINANRDIRFSGGSVPELIKPTMRFRYVQ